MGERHYPCKCSLCVNILCLLHRFRSFVVDEIIYCANALGMTKMVMHMAIKTLDRVLQSCADYCIERVYDLALAALVLCSR